MLSLHLRSGDIYLRSDTITFISVSLKIIVNGPIMKLDGMNIIYSDVLFFFDYSIFK